MINQEYIYTMIRNIKLKERFLELATNIGEFTSDEFTPSRVQLLQATTLDKYAHKSEKAARRLSSSFHGISLIARRRKGNNCCRAFFTGCLTGEGPAGARSKTSSVYRISRRFTRSVRLRRYSSLPLPGNTIHRHYDVSRMV